MQLRHFHGFFGLIRPCRWNFGCGVGGRFWGIVGFCLGEVFDEALVVNPCFWPVLALFRRFFRGRSGKPRFWPVSALFGVFFGVFWSGLYGSEGFLCNVN